MASVAIVIIFEFHNFLLQPETGDWRLSAVWANTGGAGIALSLSHALVITTVREQGVQNKQNHENPNAELSQLLLCCESRSCALDLPLDRSSGHVAVIWSRFEAAGRMEGIMEGPVPSLFVRAVRAARTALCFMVKYDVMNFNTVNTYLSDYLNRKQII